MRFINFLVRTKKLQSKLQLKKIKTDIRLQIACRRYTADMGPSAQGFPDVRLEVDLGLSALRLTSASNLV
jgi:hypothetical protein